MHNNINGQLGSEGSLIQSMLATEARMHTWLIRSRECGKPSGNATTRNNLTVANDAKSIFNFFCTLSPDNGQDLSQLWKHQHKLDENGQNVTHSHLVATAFTITKTLIINIKTSQIILLQLQKFNFKPDTHATTRYKGKEIVKPITPPISDVQLSEESSDLNTAQKDKECRKTLSSLPNTSKKILKPTNTTQTSSTHQNRNKNGMQKPELVKDSKITRKDVAVYMAKIQEVPNADSGTVFEPLEQVQYDTGNNVFANNIQQFDQSESISNTCAVETDDSNVTPDSPDMCDNDIQDDQNDVECDDEREVDIIKKTENQAKMTKLSMKWKRLCKIKAKVQKCQSQSQYRRISSQTGAGTEEYYWMQS
ncbi:hypothetical protein Tco_0520199 [Tanacetum coccineum]